MSSLQLWLAIAGGLLLAAVVAHGAWTSRKLAPRLFGTWALGYEREEIVVGRFRNRVEIDAGIRVDF